MKKSKRHNEQQSIGDVLKDFVAKNKLEKGINQVNVEHVWATVMGPAIIKYTDGMKLQNGTLFVKLSSSVLRNELSYGVSKIKDNLNEELKQDLIKKIILR